MEKYVLNYHIAFICGPARKSTCTDCGMTIITSSKVEWPTSSPDISPLDIFLSVYLKYENYRTQSAHSKNLMIATVANAKISQDFYNDVSLFKFF